MLTHSPASYPIAKFLNDLEVYQEIRNVYREVLKMKNIFLLNELTNEAFCVALRFD